MSEPASATRPAAHNCAVLGSPIAHSLSPVLHRAAYDALGLDGWAYRTVECDEASLPGLLGGLDGSWAGLSLTMPLKRAVLPLLDDVSELAVAVGGANTVTFPAGRRRGDNTDVAGIVTALTEALRPRAPDDTPSVKRPGGAPPTRGPDGVPSAASPGDASSMGGPGDPSPTRGAGGAPCLGELRDAVVLGAGATAASALAALRELGIGDVTVLARSLSRTGELREAAARLGVTPGFAPLEDVKAHLGRDLLVSTLPSGAADTIAPLLPSAPPRMAFDVVYAPWPTALGVAAAEAGATVVGGLPMLVHQAARQVELMTGVPRVPDAVVAAMRTAGEAELVRRAS